MRTADINEQQLTKAKNSAYRYLSVRPRSRTEVERKLTEKAFADSVVQTVLADLARLGYINDRNFAGQWARSRIRLRGFGRRRIEQELREKGISRDIIRDTLAGLFRDSPEIDVARREAEKKLRTLVRFEPEVRRRRLAGFLERKGFSSEIIRSIIRS
jgi:regulatory protein